MKLEDGPTMRTFSHLRCPCCRQVFVYSAVVGAWCVACNRALEILYEAGWNMSGSG